MLVQERVQHVLIFSNRLLYRYLPAIGTLLITRELLTSVGTEGYSDFAFYISLASVLPIIDFGYGNTILLGNGSKGILFSGIYYCMFLMVLVLLSAMGVVALGAHEMVDHLTFALGGVLLLPFYLLSRHCYVTAGPDNYNRRSMVVFPFSVAILWAGIHFDILSDQGAAVLCGLQVIFAAFVMGLRPANFAELKGFSLKATFKNRHFNLAGTKNLHMLGAATIAFLGAWSNVSFLYYFGEQQDVVRYDLVWRLASVTMFAQIVLNHSLPRVVRLLSTDPASYGTVYYRMLRRALLLYVGQVIAIVALWTPYQAFYGQDIQLKLLLCGLSMAAVFSLGIPGNQILLAKGRFWDLHWCFGTAAIISVGLKLFLLQGGLTAGEAFLSAAFGYAVGGVLLHLFVVRSRTNDC